MLMTTMLMTTMLMMTMMMMMMMMMTTTYSCRPHRCAVLVKHTMQDLSNIHAVGITLRCGLGFRVLSSTLRSTFVACPQPVCSITGSVLGCTFVCTRPAQWDVSQVVRSAACRSRPRATCRRRSRRHRRSCHQTSECTSSMFAS